MKHYTPDDPEQDFYSGNDKYEPDRILDLHRNIINPKDAELIKKFIANRQSTRHITESRARKILYCMIAWKRYIDKPLARLTIDDVYQGISAMKNGRAQGAAAKGRPLAQSTKTDMIKILKPFLRWMIKEQGLKIPLERIYDREDGIQAPPKPKTQITSEMILTVDEILKIVQVADNRREQAIIAVLYETGCRIGELKRMRWGDIKFDDYGVKIYIRDYKPKQKQKRYNRLTSIGKPALATLLDSLPDKKPLPDAHVFIDNRNRLIKYKYCDKLFKRCARKAGITKHVNLHLLRHCRATHMKAQGYSDSTIKKALWNNEHTNMWDIYVNLSEDDQDGEYLRMAGIDKEAVKKQAAVQAVAKNRTCYKCGNESISNAEFCWKCGDPLTDNARKNTQDLDQDIRRRDDFREVMNEDLVKLIDERIAARAANKN